MEPVVERRRAVRGLLARTLAIAYVLVIAYASLQPFKGWWIPPEDIRLFLTAPWPPFITLEDVLVNIAAYVPLGFLLARAFVPRFGIRFSVLLAAVLACAISLFMETGQMFMSARIASKVDLLTNSLGGLIGALAAPLFAPTRGLGMRLSRLRDRWFVYGPSADVGVVLVGLWLVTQLQPAAQLFGTGNLRATFDLPVWLIHTPLLLVASEAAVAGCNVLGLGLLIVALTRDDKTRGVAMAVAFGAGFAAKAFSAFALAKAAGPFSWLTPGVVIGVLAGGVLVYGLTHLPRRLQWLAASASFAAAIAAINLAPENPYVTVPPQLLVASPTHFLSFSGIVRALSELWPFLAVIYTATVAGKRPRV